MSLPPFPPSAAAHCLSISQAAIRSSDRCAPPDGSGFRGDLKSRSWSPAGTGTRPNMKPWPVIAAILQQGYADHLAGRTVLSMLAFECLRMSVERGSEIRLEFRARRTETMRAKILLGSLACLALTACQSVLGFDTTPHEVMASSGLYRVFEHPKGDRIMTKPSPAGIVTAMPGYANYTREAASDQAGPPGGILTKPAVQTALSYSRERSPDLSSNTGLTARCREGSRNHQAIADRAVEAAN